jgi:hypothetical protein
LRRLRFLNVRDNNITPPRQSRFSGRSQRIGHFFTGKVRAAAGSAGLLPPGFGNRAGVDSIKTGFLDECQRCLA